MILHIDHEKEKIALGLKQKAAQPVGQRRREVPGRLDRQGHGRQRDELRRVREARRRHRRPGAHQRDVVDQADQPSERAGAHRRRGRGRGLDINKEKQEISLGMKQTQANPWDKVAEQLPAGHAWSRARSATSPTTARSSRSKKASTACCTSATCRGPARSAIPARWSRRARRSSARCCRSIRSAAASRWA